MTFNPAYMKNMLSRSYPEEGLSNIPKSSLNYTQLTNGSWEPIIEALKELENQGVIKIIKDLRIAKADETCVVALKFFNGSEFPDYWIRD